MVSQTAAGRAKEKRAPASGSVKADSSTGAAPSAAVAETRIGFFDVVRVIGGLLLLNAALSWFVTNDSLFWGHRPSWTQPANLKAMLRGPIELTDAELSRYDGTDPSLPIYLGIDGSIYDVSASPHFYGPGAGYHIFAGCDATRAFVTGCFPDDKTPDMRGVEDMYVPRDLDAPAKLPEEATEEEKKAARTEWKLKREQARANGRIRAKAIVDNWIKTFNGGKGGKYFKVGTVKREEGWEKKLGPKKKLCERAEKQRPETSEQL